MSELKHLNIVPMGGYGRDRISEADRLLLEQCRERALKALQDSLSDMLDSADDMLFEMADKAENNTKQTLYFDAMREIRLAREATETEYLVQLEQSFTQAIGTKTSVAKGQKAETLPSGLSLLGQEQLEEDLAITNMVTKARNSAHSALFALDRRMGVLLHDPHPDTDHNPFSPDTVCAAFRQASKKIDASLEVRLLIMKLFDQYLDRDLPMVYADINDYLIGHSILPVIDEDYKSISTVRRQRQKKQHHDSYRNPAGLSADSDSNEDFTRLLQLLGNSLSAGSGLPLVGNTAQVISDLDTLQHQNLALPVQALSNQDGGTTAGMAGQSVLHTIRAQGLVTGMSQADDQTIDLVAILFDYILDDEDIPDPMKALIGRLQIPLLKVAILDKSVFSHKEHPARRLLNTLSSAALGWSADDYDSDALYGCIEGLVQRINREFVDDIALFDTIEKELCEFLEQQCRQADLRADRAAKVLQGQERLKLARQAAGDVISEVLENVELDEFVSHFLWQHVQEYLRTLHVRKGPDSEDWQQAVKLCRDLIWSCQEKSSPADRKALISMLPGLIKSLNTCMDATAIAPQERQHFMQRLADLHSQQVRPQVTLEETDPLEKTLPPEEVSSQSAEETGAENFVGNSGNGDEEEADPLERTLPQEKVNTRSIEESEAEGFMDDKDSGYAPGPAQQVDYGNTPLASTVTDRGMLDGAGDLDIIMTEQPAPAVCVDADYVSDSIKELSGDKLPALETDIEVSYESSVSREELLALFGTDQVELEEITIENELQNNDTADAPMQMDASASGTALDGPAETDLEEAPYIEQVHALNVGDWLEFALLGGKAQRVRLTWISQSTGVYLFTDRQGRKAAEKTEQGMVVEFRRASVRVIENAPLFDRALSGLMDRLSGKARHNHHIN